MFIKKKMVKLFAGMYPDEIKSWEHKENMLDRRLRQEPAWVPDLTPERVSTRRAAAAINNPPFEKWERPFQKPKTKTKRGARARALHY